MVKKRANKSKVSIFDRIMPSILLLSGLAAYFSLASKPRVIEIGYMGQRLAPPLISSWIFVFLAIFAGSMVYLILKRKKKRQSIPLSFS